MTMSDLKRINAIMLEIGFLENLIAMHRSAINKLREEKSLLMAKGWEEKEDAPYGESEHH